MEASSRAESQDTGLTTSRLSVTPLSSAEPRQKENVERRGFDMWPCAHAPQGTEVGDRGPLQSKFTSIGKLGRPIGLLDARWHAK